MDDIKVSIVIPIYNAEKYLQETLDSVAEQTFKNFEVILVNDGSRDRSLELIRNFQNENSNVILVNQENKGVSNARNNGLKRACGKYVCFLDADDILHKEYLEKLYNVASYGADVVFCEYDIFYHSTQINMNRMENKEVEELYHKYNDQVFDYIMDIGLGTSPCIKMYRTELIKKYNILFDEKSTFGEDMFFNWKFFLVASSAYYIKEKLYFYRQLVDSTTFKFHANLYESYAREYQGIRDFARKNTLNMEQIEKSINFNLLQRIPSLLRMNMRAKGGIGKKISGVRELVDKIEIQNAIQKYEKTKLLDRNLVAIKNKKYWKVFCYGCICEYRFRIARLVKHWIKV